MKTDATAKHAAALEIGLGTPARGFVLSGLAPTTVMTGNVTQWVIDAVDWPAAQGDDAVRERARKFIAPIVAFASGAIVGAFGYVQVGFAALLVPIAVLGGLSWAVGPRSGQLDVAGPGLSTKEHP